MDLTPIRIVMERYNKDDAKRIRECINEMIAHGIPRGCFQDYEMLVDLLTIMHLVSVIIEEDGNDNSKIV